jgi:U3 small nucleolar RNA-associated protein MPP10
MSDTANDFREYDNKNMDSLDRLLDILDHPVKRILPLLYGGSLHGDRSGTSQNIVLADERKETLKELISISKSLFADIETLGKQYKKMPRHSRNATSMSPTKPSESGIVELFIPPSMDPTDMDLPETIFGQVELQNEAVLKLVRKSTHKLGKATKDICVLDMGVTASSDDEDYGRDIDEDEHEQRGRTGDDTNDEECDAKGSDSVNDEESNRIHARMKRAMKQLIDDEPCMGGGHQTTLCSEKAPTSQCKDDEELYDPVAEAMKDGFFDLNEMEEFADEEEDFLPDEAFGQSEDENNTEKNETKKSFHQRQREGHLGSDSESDDDSGLDDVYEKVNARKQKKYRDPEDINVLYSLYQEPDREDDDVVNMTAADFFGAPKKHYMDRYKKCRLEGKEDRAKQSAGKADDDSWGEYDFEMEDQSAWRDVKVTTEHRNDEVGDVESEENDEATNGQLKVGGLTNNTYGKVAPVRRDEQLKRQTDELEKELLAEKPWRMSGETRSTSRPVNSLLEGTPEFKMASKQAPTITVEHTVDLEEAIKKRILAEDWDDIVPRELPDIGWHKKRGDLPAVSQEKSKLGLGELYEREYLKRAVGYDVDAAEKKTEEDIGKDEMKQLFANLCSRLDALSNYNFAPRPIADEAEVRRITAPAIAMEEVLPLHVNDARAVAPEEVYATKRGRDGILRKETEMDQGDRKRLRQSKKAARRKARKAKLADDKLISRLEPGLGLNNPYEKRKAREELATARSRGKVATGEHDQNFKFGSSGTFFKRLQTESQQAIQEASATCQRGPEEKIKAKSSTFKL